MLLTTVRFRPAFTAFLFTTAAVVAVFLWSEYRAGPQPADDPRRGVPQRVRYEGGGPDTVAVAAAAWMTDGSDLLVGGSWSEVDLIILSEPREEAAARLSALRASIVARRGRIGVIRPARVPTYHSELFGPGFRRSALLAEPEDSPMWQRLGPTLRRRFARSGPLASETRSELAERFEALLDDRGLFGDLSAYYDAKTGTASEIMSVIPVRWQPLAQWLQHHFDHREVFDVDGPALDALDLHALRRFNAICLSMWFAGETSAALGTLLPSPPGQLEAAVTQAQLRVSEVLPVASGLEVVVLELVGSSQPPGSGPAPEALRAQGDEQAKTTGSSGAPGGGDLRPFATLAQENTEVEFETKRKMIEAQARLRVLRPAAVVDSLGVAPGMSTVEIGAGTGLFAFALAEAVGPEGKSFGTEISSADLQWLKAEGERRGLRQFEAVRVGPGADDPFYAAHQFDLVLLSSVLEYIPDPVDYFRTLRGHLTPETGRVVLIQGRFARYFLPEDFAFGFRATDFLALGRSHPVRALFPHRLLDEVEKQGGGSIHDAGLRMELAAAFNQLLAEPGLFRSVIETDRAAGSDPETILRATLHPDELELWRWLYNGGFETRGLVGGAEESDILGDKVLSDLNFLSLIRWFDRGEMALRFTSLWAFYLSDSSVEERMSQAGYVLLDDGRSASGDDFLPHHSFLVFGLAPPR